MGLAHRTNQDLGSCPCGNADFVHSKFKALKLLKISILSGKVVIKVLNDYRNTVFRCLVPHALQDIQGEGRTRLATSSESLRSEYAKEQRGPSPTLSLH